MNAHDFQPPVCALLAGLPFKSTDPSLTSASFSPLPSPAAAYPFSSPSSSTNGSSNPLPGTAMAAGLRPRTPAAAVGGWVRRAGGQGRAGLKCSTTVRSRPVLFNSSWP